MARDRKSMIEAPVPGNTIWEGTMPINFKPAIQIAPVALTLAVTVSTAYADCKPGREASKALQSPSFHVNDYNKVKQFYEGMLAKNLVHQWRAKVARKHGSQWAKWHYAKDKVTFCKKVSVSKHRVRLKCQKAAKPRNFMDLSNVPLKPPTTVIVDTYHPRSKIKRRADIVRRRGRHTHGFAGRDHRRSLRRATHRTRRHGMAGHGMRGARRHRSFERGMRFGGGMRFGLSF